MAFFQSLRPPGTRPSLRDSLRLIRVFTRTTFTPNSFSTACLICVRLALRSTSKAYSLCVVARSVFFSVMMGRLMILNIRTSWGQALRQLLHCLLADDQVLELEQVENVDAFRPQQLHVL